MNTKGTNMITAHSKTEMPTKTFFIFKHEGIYFLVSSYNGVSRTQPSATYPQQVVDILKNIGYTLI